MDFAGMNYIAVGAAAAASFIFGGIWYGVLAKQWMAAAGLSEQQVKAANQGSKATLLYVRTFIAQLIMAYVLAGLIGHLGSGQVTVWNGVISAAFVWLGFVATTTVVNHSFQMRLGALTIIDLGHWLGVLLIQGAVIGLISV